VEINFKFDDKPLRELQKKVKELDGERKVALSELLPDDFIRQYTNYQTLQEMIDASGIKNTEEIGNKEFSKFIAAHTQFPTWEKMLQVAATSYYKRQLGL